MTEQLVLDGTAIGGMLGEVFAVEITATGVRCGSCGAVGEIGAIRAYVHAPGAVARCPECDGVLLRAVRGRDRICRSRCAS